MTVPMSMSFRSFAVSALLSPRVRAFAAGLARPRKPRHRIARVALGVVGVALLAVLVVVGVFVGAAMLLLGLAYRLLRTPSRRPARGDARIVDAEYRVVARPVLPASR